MPGEVVVDTSILAKVFFDEAESGLIRGWIGGMSLFAPNYVRVEIASVGLKKVREGLATEAVALAAIQRTPELIDVLTPDEDLLAEALQLGSPGGVSFYDALFAALALRLDLPLATADLKCVERLVAAGLGVRCLTPKQLDRSGSGRTTPR